MGAATMDYSALLAEMTLTNAFLLLTIWIAFKVIYQIVYYRFFHPLSNFPGPFWASVTRLWIAYYNMRGDEYLKEHELHKKYGKYNPKLP
jgi:hypothetical protein